MSRKLNIVLLVLNLALLAGFAYVWHQNRSREIAAEEPQPEPPPAATNEPIIIKTVEREVVTNHFHWGQLESEDYRQYIERLRSIGCPEQTIHDIIIADLDKLLAPKVSIAGGHRKNLQYWQSEEEELANDWDAREVARKMQEIDREKRNVIQELAGVDLVRERLKQKGIEDYYERRLSFLPDDKQSQMRRILEKYDEQERAIRDKEIEEGEALSPKEKAMLHSIRAQRQAEVSAVLTPEESKQYELWMSPTANAVRHSLYGMNASERDFQTAYSIRKSFDEQWGQQELDSMDAATQQRYETAKTDMDAQLKGQLGDEKYRAYKRGEDQDYHGLCATLTRLKLPRHKAEEVYEMKQALVDAQQAVASNATLTPEQRENLLKALSDETERAARQALGDKGFNSYLRSGYAQWLRN